MLPDATGTRLLGMTVSGVRMQKSFLGKLYLLGFGQLSYIIELLKNFGLFFAHLAH
jgi:hypothetical protein